MSKIRRNIIRDRDGTIHNLYVTNYGDGPFAQILTCMFMTAQLAEWNKRKLPTIQVLGQPLLVMQEKPYIDRDALEIVRIGVKLEQLATALHDLQHQADLFRLLTTPFPRGQS